MENRAKLKLCQGKWVGTNQLWVEPEEPVRESETTVSVALIGGGAFAQLTYNWLEKGEHQDGVLLIRLGPNPSASDMVWLDSWHTGGDFMVFRRDEDRDDTISALGSYPAPPGPDWGWRITLEADPESELRLLMYNITPAGDEALAVKAIYRPAKEG